MASFVAQLEEKMETEVLNEFKRKFFADHATEVTFSYHTVQLEDKLNGINHKLNRVVCELKFIETNYAKYLELTSREKEVIRLLVTGCNNPEISRTLFISRRTVEQHRKNIIRKLETNSIPDLCAFAYAFNLI